MKVDASEWKFSAQMFTLQILSMDILIIHISQNLIETNIIYNRSQNGQTIQMHFVISMVGTMFSIKQTHLDFTGALCSGVTPEVEI